MSLVDVVLSRRSIRRYEQKNISMDVLDRILEADRRAPSAMNRQPWHFIVLTVGCAFSFWAKKDNNHQILASL